MTPITQATTHRVLSYAGGSPVIRQDPVPRIDCADDIVVELEVAGLCRTDLYVANGTLKARPRVVLGHEASGRVVECGPAAALRPSTRVAFDPRVPCGTCRTCSMEGPSPARCLTPHRLGVERDGVFAQYVAVPARNAIPIGPGVSALRAAYLEPVAAALGALSPVQPDLRGAIVGQGRIAELTARLFELDGRPRPHVQTATQLAESGEMFPFVVDAGLPTADALASMTRAVLPGGTLVMKSRPVGQLRFSPAEWVSRDLQVSAVSYGSFERAAAALRDERLQLDDLFGPERPLESFADVFRDAAADESVKQFFNLGRD